MNWNELRLKIKKWRNNFHSRAQMQSQKRHVMIFEKKHGHSTNSGVRSAVLGGLTYREIFRFKNKKGGGCNHCPVNEAGGSRDPPHHFVFVSTFLSNPGGGVRLKKKPCLECIQPEKVVKGTWTKLWNVFTGKLPLKMAGFSSGQTNLSSPPEVVRGLCFTKFRSGKFQGKVIFVWEKNIDVLPFFHDYGGCIFEKKTWLCKRVGAQLFVACIL